MDRLVSKESSRQTALSQFIETAEVTPQSSRNALQYMQGQNIKGTEGVISLFGKTGLAGSRQSIDHSFKTSKVGAALFRDDDPCLITDCIEKTISQQIQDTLTIKTVRNVTSEQFIADNPEVDRNNLAKNKIYNYTTYQSKIDPGWHLEGTNNDGTLRLSKEMQLKVNHKDDHNGLIETVGKVSDKFRKQVEDKVKEIPESVRKALEKAGYKVVLAPSVIEGLPELKGQSYRGWSPGFTFKNLDGTQDAERRLIILGEHYVDEGLLEKARENQPGHQFGHAFDALGKTLQGKYFSQTEAFLQVYEKDVQKYKKEIALMSDEDKKKTQDSVANYLAQPNGGGPRETFASIFGMLTNGPENPGDDIEIRRLFPLTVAYMQDQFSSGFNSWLREPTRSRNPADQNPR